MHNNDFMLDIIAKLNKQLSNKQLKNDLKGIDNTLSVKVIAKLATALSKKQLGDSLKQLNNLYVQVGTKFKTDKDTRNKLLNEIEQLQKNLTELQLKVNVEKGASQNAISSVISTAKTAQRYADKTSITLDVEVRKEKAINDILYIGQKYSKLFSNLSASQKYENLLNSAYSISDKSQLQEVRASISAFTSELKAGGLAAESTGKKWRKLIDRAKELFSAASVVRTIFVQAKQAVSTTIDLDKVYTDLVKVNDELNRNDYADYLSRCNQKAQELATTQKALIEGATEFSKSGYNLSTSDALTEKSTILANVGDMGASDSAKAIISGVQAYDVVDGYTDVEDKAGALIDKYNELGNTASITTKELAQGVQAVGSVFADANTSVDQFLSLLSAGNRQYQNADSLALGLRTAALRIRGASTELEEAGEDIEGVMSVLDNQKSIKALTGVDILEKDQQTIRSIYDIFLDISKVYKDMSDVDQSALLDIIAGKHRASAISATLNNMTEAETILQNSLNAAGSAQREYDTYLESTEAHLQQFQAKLVETYSAFINGDMISHAADLGSAILDLINKTDLLKHGLIAIATLKIGQGISAAGGIVAGTITQMNTLGNAIQQVKSLPLDKVLRKSALDDIGESTKALTEKNLKLLLSQKQLNDSDKMIILSKHNLTEEEALSKLETLGLTTATNANTAANTANAGSVNTLKGAFTGLTASVKAAWAAMSALQKASIIFAAISTAWSIGSSIINGIKQNNEELRQATKESANAYKESASSIDDYAKRYQELHKALLEAKGNEEETYNIKQQLLDLQTELNDKFGEEYGKLNLVTDAYKDQTEAIKALNKEVAQTFLNENQKGIEDAVNAMTKGNRRYNLSYMGMSSYTDESMALKEIAKKYENQGLKINEDESNGTYNLILTTDAQSAYNTINAFENDVRAKAKELGNEHIFDDVLEFSSSELNNAKETIDEYGEIYKQALMAEIVTDDNRADTYNEATKAVQEYNEAVLSSEDPFNDEAVQKARENLNALKAEMQNDDGSWNVKWQKYASVIEDIFNQADTRLIDFDNAIKNDMTIQELVNKLKGLDNLDVQGIVDSMDGANRLQGVAAQFANITSQSDEVKNAVAGLIHYADEYELETEELIDALTRLGYVQSEIASSTEDVSNAFAGWDALNEQIDSIQSSYKAIQAAQEEYNQYGYVSMDTLQALISLDSEYLACLIDENGQLQLNSATYQQLVQAKLAEAEATAVSQAMTELQAIANGEAAASTVDYITGNAELMKSLALLAGQYGNVANAAMTAAQAQALSAAIESANGVDSAATEKVMANLNAKLALIQNTAQKTTSSFGGLNNAVNGFSNAQKGAGNATKDTNDALNAQKEALEAEKEALQEQKEAAEEALQAQIDGIDDVIKGKEKEIDLLDDEIDKIKKAREERKHDIELQKAQYDLERMQNQRTKLVNYMPDTIVI